MRLEWIDDILAVYDHGSLARAAERRFLTQSAFTRRIRLIEQTIGATLIDRRRKPVTLMPGVKALEPDLRDLSARLHEVRQTLKRSNDQADKSVSFVCQHALAATVSPRIVRGLTAKGQTSVRVRSGNQDECLMKLVSRSVDFAIMYAVPEADAPETGSAFDAVTLGTDMLVPVCAPQVRAAAAGPAIPTISYPPDGFLGQICGRAISPRLPPGTGTVPVVETALTLAMLQFALDGIGVAWLPRSLVAEQLERGRLVRLDHVLPAQELQIRMIRLAGNRPPQDEAVWQHLVEVLRSPVDGLAAPGD
jgi:DNA-binding transcriptional LysR family regulator